MTIEEEKILAAKKSLVEKNAGNSGNIEVEEEKEKLIPKPANINTRVNVVNDYTKEGSLIRGVDGQSNFEALLSSSNRTIDDYKFTAEKRALVENRLAKNIMLFDAVQDTVVGRSLKTLTIDDATFEPGEGAEVLNVDTYAMKTAIVDANLNADDTYRYNRVANAIRNIQNSGFKIIRANDGRYWVESEENGVKEYAVNGLLDIREAINKFHGKAGGDNGGDGDGDDGNTIIDDNAEELPVIEDVKDFKFSKAEKWYLAGLTSDVVTTFGGMATKGFAGAGAVVSFIGGLFSAGADAYGDYLSGKSGWDIATNAATRVGLEAVEAVTFAPVSLIRKFKTGSAVAKMLNRGLRWMMAANYVDVAIGTRWKELFEKVGSGDISSLTVDDWRETARALTMITGATSGYISKRDMKKQLGIAAKKSNVNTKSVRADIDKVVLKDKNIDAVSRRNDIKGRLAGRKNQAEVGVKQNKLGDKVLIEKVNTKNKIAKIKSASKKKIESFKSPRGKKKAFIKSEKEIDAVQLESNKKIEKLNTIISANEKTLIARNKGIEAESVANTNRFKAEEEPKIFKREARKREGEYKTTEKKAVRLLGKTQGKRSGRLALKKAEHSSERISPVKKKSKTVKKGIIKKKEVSISSKKADLDKVEENLKGFKGDDKAKKALTDEKKDLTKSIERLEKDLVVDKKTRKSLVKRAWSSTGKGFSAVGRGLDFVGYNLTPNTQFSNIAGLRTLVNTSIPLVGKGERYKIPYGKEAVDYLVTEGYGKSEIAKLSKKEQQNVIRYIKYQRSNVEKKRNGGTMKLLIPKKVIKAQKGILTDFWDGLVGNTERKTPIAEKAPMTGIGNKIFLNEDGYAVNMVTNRWMYDNDPSNTIYKNPKVSNPAKIITPLSKVGEGVLPQVPGLISRASSIYNPEVVQSEDINIYIDENGVLSKDNVKTSWWYDPSTRKYYNAAGADSGPIDVYIKNNTAKVLSNLGKATGKGDPVVIPTLPSNEEEEEGDPPVIIPEKRAGVNPYTAPTQPIDKKWNGALEFLNTVKPSDFLFNNYRIEEGYIRNDVQPTTLNTGIIKNMPGLDEYMNRSSRIPKLDTSDSFANYAFQSKAFNDSLKNRAELIEKNNAYVDQQRMRNQDIVNQNRASTTAAMNQNIAAANKDAMMTAQSRLQSKKEQRDFRVKKLGNILNDSVRLSAKLIKKKRNMGLMDDYYSLAKFKNLFDTDYQPYINKLASEGKIDDINKLKSSFESDYGINPDDLTPNLLQIRTELQ